MLFTAPGGEWNVAGNWLDLNNPAYIHIPTQNDDVGIPATAGPIVISGQNADINSIVMAGGAAGLTISSGVELKLNSNPPTTPPPGMPVSPIAGQNFFGGPVFDPGRINLNTTNVLAGTIANFAGGTDIGPGDLNGNLVAGPNSSFNFIGSGSIGNTFEAGATFGIGAGYVNIAAPVSVMGNLIDGTAVLQVQSGGTLGGPGSVTEEGIANWTGGSITVGAGITVTQSGHVNVSGNATKTLGATLSNLGEVNLDGTGPLAVLLGGSITNEIGASLEISLPTLGAADGVTVGVTNVAGGFLTIDPSGSSPTVISAPFTNEGYMSVSAGPGVAMTATPTVGPGGTPTPTIDLDGSIALTGNLYLLSMATSDTGMNLSHGGGYLEVGSTGGSGPMGTLIVPAGVTDTMGGNVEINDGSLLTGGGTYSNNGLLRLDLTGSTAGLGYYAQANNGILAEEVGGPGINAVLAVTGTASLSGTLELLDYTPVVGDSFTVVTAAKGRYAHFDSVPDGMVESDGPTSASVTQVQPPA
jgi:hypothetical protein